MHNVVDFYFTLKGFCDELLLAENQYVGNGIYFFITRISE